MPEIDHDAWRKTEINKGVQARYDQLRAEGKHGHYETMFKVVHEQRADAVATLAEQAKGLAEALEEAMEAVKFFHGPVAWEIYRDESPEMKRWRAALARYRESKGEPPCVMP